MGTVLSIIAIIQRKMFENKINLDFKNDHYLLLQRRNIKT